MARAAAHANEPTKREIPTSLSARIRHLSVKVRCLFGTVLWVGFGLKEESLSVFALGRSCTEYYSRIRGKGNGESGAGRGRRFRQPRLLPVVLPLNSYKIKGPSMIMSSWTLSREVPSGVRLVMVLQTVLFCCRNFSVDRRVPSKCQSQ